MLKGGMGKLMTKFNDYACQKELIISNWLEAGSLEILLNEREEDL